MFELLVLLAVASPQPLQVAQAADTARCERLAAYYDRYAQRGEGAQRNGAFDRAIGGDRCKAGDTKAGEALLEKAIIALGFTPPK